MVEFRQWSEEEPVEVDKPLDLDEEIEWVVPWQKGKDGFPRRGATIYKIGALPVSLMERILKPFRLDDRGIGDGMDPSETAVKILANNLGDNFAAARIATIYGLKGIEWPEELRGKAPAFKAVTERIHGTEYRHASPEVVNRLTFKIVYALGNAVINLSQVSEPEKKV